MVTSLMDHPPDALVALHGIRSHAHIQQFRLRFPSRSIALVLTGTDLYPEPPPACVESMEAADFLVVLHPGALNDLPPRFRSKGRVIVQSARRRAGRPTAPDRPTFNVCVVGHLRAVKDPLLVMRAARRLAPASRLQVVQAGGVLEPEFAAMARREMVENPRYTWLGELDPERVSELLAASDLMVLSSRLEGGARVIGEALVHGTPVLSSRIAAAEALLGSDYPGLFPVGDVEQLAKMMHRSEFDPAFLQRLKEICAVKAGQFDPAIECAAVRALVADLLANDHAAGT